MNQPTNESVEIIDLTNETTSKHNTTITIDDSFVQCISDSPKLEKIDEDVEIFQDYPPDPSPLPYVSAASSPESACQESSSQQQSEQPKKPPTPIFSSSTSSSELTPPNTPPSNLSSTTPRNQSSSTSRSFESTSSDSKNPRTTKAALKELKRKEREEVRQQKLKQKEEEKLLREVNRANAASRALDNCTAKIDSTILKIINDLEEVALKTLFDESMIRYELVQTPKLENSIIWTYRRVEIKDGTCEETYWDSDWTMIVVEGEDYLRRLIAFRDKPEDQTSIKRFLTTCRESCNSDLIVVVYNLSGYLKSERQREAKNYKRTFKDRFEGARNKNQDETTKDTPVVTNIGVTDLQELRLRLELELKHEFPEWKLHFEFQEKTNDVVQLFARYTSSVAKLEIKRRTKTSTGIDWAINVDKERAVDPCKSSEDLTKLWIAQLQQFTQVTLPIAKAIAAEYPSPCALLDQYSTLTQPESENLLAELYIQRNLKRQIGQSISRRIYKFMTCEDPDIHIGLS